ncbi:hypothetical protein, partial [Burkholderia pseudomallei]|uniref:hypothetical protein n=1 Tax=Burkholderia pseudomallei TaxID=28450 RepID=UPI001E2AF82A
RPTSSSSGIVQLKQPRPFSKIEMARRNQAGHSELDANSDTGSFPCQARQEVHDAVQINGAHAQPDVDRDAWQL